MKMKMATGAIKNLIFLSLLSFVVPAGARRPLETTKSLG
jgi:hypothetical protein